MFSNLGFVSGAAFGFLYKKPGCWDTQNLEDRELEPPIEPFDVNHLKIISKVLMSSIVGFGLGTCLDYSIENPFVGVTIVGLVTGAYLSHIVTNYMENNYCEGSRRPRATA